MTCAILPGACAKTMEIWIGREICLYCDEGAVMFGRCQRCNSIRKNKCHCSARRAQTGKWWTKCCRETVAQWNKRVINHPKNKGYRDKDDKDVYEAALEILTDGLDMSLFDRMNYMVECIESTMTSEQISGRGLRYRYRDYYNRHQTFRSMVSHTETNIMDLVLSCTSVSPDVAGLIMGYTTLQFPICLKGNRCLDCFPEIVPHTRQCLREQFNTQFPTVLFDLIIDYATPNFPKCLRTHSCSDCWPELVVHPLLNAPLTAFRHLPPKNRGYDLNGGGCDDGDGKQYDWNGGGYDLNGSGCDDGDGKQYDWNGGGCDDGDGKQYNLNGRGDDHNKKDDKAYVWEKIDIEEALCDKDPGGWDKEDNNAWENL
jgi:hypothetical protein